MPIFRSFQNVAVSLLMAGLDHISICQQLLLVACLFIFKSDEAFSLFFHACGAICKRPSSALGPQRPLRCTPQSLWF